MPGAREFVRARPGEGVEEVAERIIDGALNFVKKGDVMSALDLYDAYVDEYIHSGDPFAGYSVSLALLNKGLLFERLGRHAEALPAYRQLTDRYAKAVDPETRVQVARGYVWAGRCYVTQRDSASAIVQFDRAISYVGPVVDVTGNQEGATIDLWDALADAFQQKATVLYDMGKPELALEEYARVSQLFDGCMYTLLQVAVGKALFNRGAIMMNMGDRERASRIFSEIEQRYSGLEAQLPELEGVLQNSRAQLTKIRKRG
jgi:tetratricopeptide (TPR) repeat protein